MDLIFSTLWRIAPLAMAALALAACHAESASVPAAPPVGPAASTPTLGTAKEARYVKLEALSEWNGKSWTSVAEFNLIDSTGTLVDRKSWVASSDSAAANDRAQNAIDGDPRTLWHSRWEGASPAPLPHNLTVDLGKVVRLSGFRYLGRQDNSANGTIAKYRFYVSSDGQNWGAPVAEGDFWQQGAPSVEKTVLFAAQTPNSPPQITAPAPKTSAFGDFVSLPVAATDPDGDVLQYSARGLPTGLTIDPKSGVISGTPIAPGLHTVELSVSDKKAPDVVVKFDWVVDAPRLTGAAPAAGEARFVKLEEVSSVNGPWAAVAEFNLVDANGANLPRDGWRASADSAAANDRAENAIDGDPRTLWHSQWDGIAPEPPHSLVIDLGRPTRIHGLRMLPRQDGPTNGTIAKFRFYTSVDGVNWGKPVAEGDFSTMGPPLVEKTVRLR